MLKHFFCFGFCRRFMQINCFLIKKNKSKHLANTKYNTIFIGWNVHELLLFHLTWSHNSIILMQGGELEMQYSKNISFKIINIIHHHQTVCGCEHLTSTLHIFQLKTGNLFIQTQRALGKQT